MRPLRTNAGSAKASRPAKLVLRCDPVLLDDRRERNAADGLAVSERVHTCNNAAPVGARARAREETRQRPGRDPLLAVQQSRSPHSAAVAGSAEQQHTFTATEVPLH